MRVTNNMLSRNMTINLTAAQGRLDKLQNQMATGQQISKPSDDPAGVQNALRYKSSLAAVEQWQKNADEALSFMDTTDGLLGDTTAMLQRVRELAVQGANGSLAPANRTMITDEIGQIKEQLRILGNSQFGNKSVFAFGGLVEDQREAIDADFFWQGNDKDTYYPVGNGVEMSISTDGRKVFGFDGENTLFSVLDQLMTDINSGSNAKIGDSLSLLDQKMDTITKYRAEIGARSNRMTSLRDQLENSAYSITSALTKFLDADIAKTTMNFKNQENVYKAALSVGAQIIQPSLVDFMR